MYGLPQIFSVCFHGLVTGKETICKPEIYRQSRLVNKKPDQGQVQVEKTFRSGFDQRKEFIPVIFEKSRSAVGGGNRPEMLRHPVFPVIDPYFPYRYLMRAVFMDDRKSKGFLSGLGIYHASVPVRLLLIVFACLQIDYRRNYPVRRQGKLFRHGGEILHWREIRRTQKHRHYSSSPFALEDIPLTMPLFEFLIKSRIVSRSSLCGNPDSILAQASLTLNPAL